MNQNLKKLGFQNYSKGIMVKKHSIFKMNTYKILAFLGLIPLFLSGQPAESSFDSMVSGLCSGSVPFVWAEELKNSVDEGEEFYLFDSREKKEFETSHIPNAIWVGYESFNKGKVKGLDRNKKVIVYCSVGFRSEKIGEKLSSLGFSDVLNLHGGIFDWVNQGNKVVDSKGEKTEKVHTYNEDWSRWLERGEKVYE